MDLKTSITLSDFAHLMRRLPANIDFRHGPQEQACIPHRHCLHASLGRRFATSCVADRTLGRWTARRSCRRDFDDLSSDAKCDRFDDAFVCSRSSVKIGAYAEVNVSEVAAYCLSSPDRPVDFCDSGPTIIAVSPWQVRVEFVVGRFWATERDPLIMYPNPLPEDFFSKTEDRIHITVLGDAVPGSPFAPLFLGADEIEPANCEFHASNPVIFAGEGGSVGVLDRIRDRFGNSIRPLSLVDRISGSLTLLSPPWTPIEDKPAEITPTWLFTNWYISMQVNCYVAGQYRLNIDYAQDNDTAVPIPIRLSNIETLQPNVTVECAPGRLHSILLQKQGDAVLGSEVNLVAQACDEYGNAAYFSPAAKNDALGLIEEPDMWGLEVLVEHESCGCAMLKSLDVELIAERPGCLSIRFSTTTVGKHTVRVLYMDVDYVQNPFVVEFFALHEATGDGRYSKIDTSPIAFDRRIDLLVGESKFFYVYLRDEERQPTEGSALGVETWLVRKDNSSNMLRMPRATKVDTGVIGTYRAEITTTIAASYWLVVAYKFIKIPTPYNDTVVVWNENVIIPERSGVAGSALGVEIGWEQYTDERKYREVVGRNMSLEITAYDPFGNEHTTTRPGFYLNEEFRSATSWMQVIERGNGRTRFYFSIERSDIYYLRVEVAGSLAYQANLEVVPAEPFHSNCRVDVPSVFAGEEALGFLQVQDRFSNIYLAKYTDMIDLTQFTITLTHSEADPEDGVLVPHRFPSYHTVSKAYQFPYMLTRSGEYTIAATLQNSPVQGNGDTFVVWHLNDIVADRSGVAGSALGVEIGWEQYTDEKKYREVVGRNMSLEITAYDPYGNEHTTTRPGFYLNEEFRSATSRMQVFEHGDGQTRFYFSIERSDIYYLRVEVAGSLAYKANLEVVPDKPFHSNCRVDVPSVFAGEEALGFLQVQDRFSNIYLAKYTDMIDLTQFTITLTHSEADPEDGVLIPHRFPSYHTVSKAYQFPYMLTRSGEYTIAATLQNSPVQGNGDTFVVWHLNDIVADRSGVAGSALGVEIGWEQYTDEKKYREVVGRNMSLEITAYDPFGNEHTTTRPGFYLNEEFRSATSRMQVFEHGDGQTRFYFSIERSDIYYLRVEVAGSLAYKANLEVVPDKPFHSNCRVDVPSVFAGEEALGFLQVQDRFSNIYLAKYTDMIDLTQFTITLTHSEADPEDGVLIPHRFPSYHTVSKAYQFPYMLTRSGEYTITATLKNSPVQGNGDTFVVWPSNDIVADRSGVAGSALGVEIGWEQYTDEKKYREVVGRNMSLEITAYDPYGNEHTTTRPGFYLNEEFRSATSRMQVFEHGDGQTRFYFSIERSDIYYLRVEVAGSLAYKANLEVVPDKPFHSNCRVFDVPSISAGEEALGFLQVQDHLSNVYVEKYTDMVDLTQFRIGLTLSAVDPENVDYVSDFTYYNTEAHAFQFRYTLTRTGEYKITATLKNSPIQGNGNTFVVWPSNDIVPERSPVAGSALGVEVGWEQYLEAEDYREVAGRNMSLMMTAVDPYGNVHTSTKPGFELNEEIRSAASWMQVFEHGDGKTRFYFSIWQSATYYLRVELEASLAYHANLEVVPAEPFHSNCRVLDVSSVSAGKEALGFLQVQDHFSNVYVAKYIDMVDLAQFSITLTHSTENQEHGAHPVVYTHYNTELSALEFRCNLTRSGAYKIAATFQNLPIQGNGMTIGIRASAISYSLSQAADAIPNIVAGAGIEIRIITRDFYGNIASEEADLALRTRIDIHRASTENGTANATVSIVEVHPGLLAGLVNVTTVGSYTSRVQIDGNDISSGNSSFVVHPAPFDVATSAILLATNVSVGEWNNIMLLPMDRFRNVLAPLSNLSIVTNATSIEIRQFGLAGVGDGWMRAQYWLGNVGNFTLDVQRNATTIWNFSITAAVSSTATITIEDWTHTSIIGG